MKRKLLYGIVAAACMALTGAGALWPEMFPSLLAFPLAQISAGLRALSLSGAAGNTAAWALYLLVSLSPCGGLVVLAKKGGLYAEDTLLGVLSALLLGVLYGMINPGIWSFPLGGEFLAALLGGVVWSVVLGWAALRLLRRMTAADGKRLGRYMAVLVEGLNLLFVYLAAGVCFGEYLEKVDAFRVANTMPGSYRPITLVFLALGYAADALPYLLDIGVGCAALAMLSCQQQDRYSEATAQAAEKLARRSVRALAITVASGVAMNLLQLLFLPHLANVDAHVQLPVFSLAFVLFARMLAQYVRESKRLKDDNDSFI